MDSASLITQGYGDRSVFTEVEVIAIVMVVGSNPSNPHAGRVLTGEDSHRVVVLQGHMRELAEVRSRCRKQMVKKKKKKSSSTVVMLL